MFSPKDVSEIRDKAQSIFVGYPSRIYMNRSEVGIDDARIMSIYESVILFLNKRGAGLDAEKFGIKIDEVGVK
jgi:hypothetical protein